MENQFNNSELLQIIHMSIGAEQEYLNNKKKTNDKDVKEACQNLADLCKEVRRKAEKMLEEMIKQI